MTVAEVLKCDNPGCGNFVLVQKDMEGWIKLEKRLSGYPEGDFDVDCTITLYGTSYKENKSYVLSGDEAHFCSLNCFLEATGLKS